MFCVYLPLASPTFVPKPEVKKEPEPVESQERDLG